MSPVSQQFQYMSSLLNPRFSGDARRDVCQWLRVSHLSELGFVPILR